MEYCPEGTLEALVSSTEAGLEESMVRRYTRQLLQVQRYQRDNRELLVPLLQVHHWYQKTTPGSELVYDMN